ncbi:hypothetical protein [Methylobacterium brachythecii]|uniref:Uncharacterized protein n=1 Tax=Methylobacterium brachythecii TaxID=1176177 RepID=A0A7W6AP92_9HYPH|nr:hypothetical protein [Methylobacterium brachythecii]MBB3904755.1 hypothetical protein [Methylobacterium brachythecii]GLS45569.1 hypothetical protein GCM10007884_35600 [Methylobacterium brachythecii]
MLPVVASNRAADDPAAPRTGLAWRIFRRLLGRGRTKRTAAKSAQELIAEHGGLAYQEARRRARNARSVGFGEGDRYWSRVAREIGRLEGREIGVKTADRYGN